MADQLILIDVDGPLNPWAAKPTRRPEGYTTIRIPQPTHGCPPHRWPKLRVWLNPAHGPRLLKLAEDTGAELVWATTWEHEASVHIAPVIGLPTDLPVIEWGFKAHHWKYDGVLEYTSDRPFVWFDDDFGRFDLERHWFEGKRGSSSKHLLHYVDPKVGLTEKDFVQAEKWLKENS